MPPSKMSPQPDPKRRRGAPPGNLNALKHGFYSRKLPKADISGIEDFGENNLAEEINILRVFTRRVIELGKDVDSLPDALSLLRVLCIASTSLNRLMMTQKKLSNDQDLFSLALDQVLKELSEELINQDSLEPPQES